jgi:zinc protease
MMNEDTQDHTAEQMQQLLQTLGSSVVVGADFDDINFSVQTLTKNLDKTLPLLEERLLRPKFTAAAFERLKRQTLESFKARKAQPALVATEVFAKINHGPASVLGVNPSGTEETVRALTLADVEDYHARFVTARGAKLVVVGDITQADITGRLGFLAKLPARDVKLPAVPAAPAVAKTRVYVVDVPKAAQTEFRVGYVTGLKYDVTGEFYRAGLMNYILGGAFNSRLNMNLREDKAWTYGARSGFTASKYSGNFTFSSGIRADATGGALTEILQELNAYAKSGITTDELTFTQSALGQRDALLYETPLQKAGFIRRIMDYDLPGDFVDTQNKILATMPKSEIDRLAAKWIKTDAVNILLVGDKTKILPAIAHFGYEVTELTPDGTPVVPQ